MPGIAELSDDELEARIKRLRDILAQNVIIEGALEKLIIERARRKTPPADPRKVFLDYVGLLVSAREEASSSCRSCGTVDPTACACSQEERRKAWESG